MTHAIVSSMLSLVVADPLAGIAVGGSAGVVAALLCAAMLGSALNALRRTSGVPLRENMRHSPFDHHFRHAA